MFNTTIFDQAHLGNLKQALTVYSRRHRVVSENIANVETKDFQAKEYRFESLLRSAGGGDLRGTQTHRGHMPIGAHDASETMGEVQAQDTGYDNGVNDVNVDTEMTSLATTELSYRLATRVLSMKYSQLREAVSGRVR
jgi:flagellar basal-body rod protein FlgB